MWNIISRVDFCIAIDNIGLMHIDDCWRIRMGKKKTLGVITFVLVVCSMLIMIYKEQGTREEAKLVLPFDLIEVGGTMATYTYFDRYIDLNYFYTLDSNSTCEEVEKKLGKPNGVLLSTEYPYYEVKKMYVAIHYSKDEKIIEILLYSQYGVRGIIYLDDSLEAPTEQVAYLEEELLFVELFKDNQQELEKLVEIIKGEKSFYIEEDEGDADERIVFSIFFDSEPFEYTEDPGWIRLYYTSGTFSSRYNGEIADRLNENEGLKATFQSMEEKGLIDSIDIVNEDYTFHINRKYTTFNPINSNQLIYSGNKEKHMFYKPIEGNWYMFVPLGQE